MLEKTAKPCQALNPKPYPVYVAMKVPVEGSSSACGRDELVVSKVDGVKV